MQSFLSLPISSMYSAIRVDESQLTELSSRARRNPIKEGCLCKISDTKGKKATEKWCAVYCNMLFYYDTTSYKPSGVIFLEDCHCHPVVSEAAQSDCPPRYDVENGFSLGYNDDSSARHYVFLSQSLDDRTEWIKVINGASMSRLHNELQALKTKFENVEKRLMSAGTEVVHLRQQHSDAQGNIASLRATLTIPSVKRSKSVGTVSSTLGGSSLLTMNEKNRLELEEHSARILQTHIRGWIIRKRWLRVVQSYVNSPHSEMMKKRNKLIWKLVASEEDYVSQLTVLRGEFQQQLMITACSLKPYLSLEQCMDVFRNCDELLLFHQLYLRALHCAVEKWPVVNLGDVFKLFTPMLAVYHQYIGNHRYSLEVLFELKLKQQFKTFLETLEKKPACKQMTLDDLLSTPLNRISVYIQEIEELRAHTPSEHVDYQPMANAISELEMIQKTVTDEVSFSEGIRQVLSVERKIEGGCQVLLDKEQSLIRKGFLMLSRVGPVGDDKQNSRKLRKASSYCFLFSKHLLISQRISKKKEELYRLHKDIGILNLAKCRVKDHNKSERPEMRYLGIIIEYENESVKQEFQFLAMGVSEKAQWMADITQCIVNEKENLILESQSKGELVELSSNFIRYSTFRAGKEQLVNSGNLQNLLNRLIRVSFMGLEFLNTFLMTFTMYTTSTVVMDYLINNYKQVIENRTKQKKVVSPEDQVKGARALTFPTNSIPQQLTSHPITFPRRSPNHIKSIHSMDQPLISVTGVFFALKHWICKHFHHFQKSVELENKLQKLLDLANKCTVLSIAEKKVVTELSSLFAMQQKGDDECTCPVIEYLYQCDIISTPDLFAALLLWEPRMLAEQLCLIENVLFCRIGNDELLRYINSSNDERPTSAPNVVCIIQHFNRMSLYWMWSVAKQPTDTDRAKVLELLIVTASECLQLCNFMSMMQIVAALEHSSVLRFTNMWAMITKNVKQQHRAIKRVSSTDGRYRSLRQATRDATPPMIPYLATTLAELVSLKEAMPSYVEGDLINFTKMRRITRTVKSVLQHQKDPYEFTLISEVAKLLLTTPIQEDQEVLYSYVDDILLVSKPVL